MPDAADGEAIASLFGDAIERPAGERHAFVLAAEVPEAVRQEVLSLLAVHERRGARAERLDPARAAAVLADFAPQEVEAGRRIGPYRIVRQLGRGGMGVVYLAERADGAYEQRVAVKLLPAALRSDALARRFELERQILAHLEHPGIAHLLDGGIAEHGEPYIVLEYVQGEPLTRWCDEQRLPVAERLRLFLYICDAVQYAHGRLVVHRDLKPSNVLVTGDGQVKLLDFGIAKLLSEEGEAEATALTRLGLRPYTPGYAAPEQLRGEAVTVATDVYSLGVLLYELLTGCRPHGTGEDDAPRADDPWRPPPRPSTAFARPGEPRSDGEKPRVDPEEIARRRATSPERLRRRLAGDLDTIALKALREEPEQRYESVQALTEDVGRHLAGMPIAARPASVGYRGRKFLRRHWVGATAAALVIAAVLAGLTGVAWQSRVAQRERDAARAEAAKAIAVQQFLADLFRSAAPQFARGETITAEQLLERGVERIDEELSEQPEVQLEMLLVLSDVERELGRAERAARLATRAVVLAHELYGKEHLTVARALHALGHIRDELGEWDAAEPLLAQALAQRRRLLGGEHEDVAHTLDRLAHTLAHNDDHERAEKLFEEALAMRRRLHGDEDRRVANSLNNYALLLRDAGRYAESAELLREALAIRDRLELHIHPGTANARNNLALALEGLGEFDEAITQYERALEIHYRVLGDEHPNISTTHYNIARLLQKQGDYEAAVERLRQVLALDRKLLGEEHHYVAQDLLNLSAALAESGALDEALAAVTKTQTLFASGVGEEHHTFALSLARQAVILHYQGNSAEALSVLRRALSGLREALGPDHPDRASWLDELGRMQMALGDSEAAAATCRKALAVQRERLPESHPDVAHTLTALGWALVAQGKAAEAVPILREAVEMADDTLPESHWLHADARAALGASLSRLGRLTEADPLLRSGYADLLEARPAEHPDSRLAHRALADHLARLPEGP